MREWLASVYSDGSKYFVSNPLPKKGEKITISLRCIVNEDLKHVILRGKVNGAEQLITMEKDRVENGLQFYSCKVTPWEDVFHYQFYLVTEEEIYYYTQYRITDYVPDEIYDFRILTDYEQPSWVREAVFYQIFPDRFCNGNPHNDVKDREYQLDGWDTIQVKDWNKEPEPFNRTHGLDFYGGDLEGIQEKIAYLKELGVTAVYVNPIFQAASVHRYDCMDYSVIDPHLGGNEALVRLSEALHEQGMKLVLDISINHTGTTHKWFNKDGVFYPKSVGAYNNKQARERSYYFFHDGNDYDTWCGVKNLPALNYTDENLREIVYRGQDSIIKKWIKEPYKIDGWRFDVGDVMARNNLVQLHKEIWPEIRKSIKEENKEAYIVGEDWADCIEHLQGDEWDATMNYFACARPIREFVGEIDLFQQRKEELQFSLKKMTAKNFKNRITQYYGKLPYVMQEIQFNLIDSHDVSRLHNNTSISFEDYKAAVVLYFTLPGAPCIYYGDEVGIQGKNDVEGCRYPMPWSKDMEKTIYYKMYHQLANLKKKNDALAYGGLQFLSNDDYVISYVRCTDTKAVFIIASVDDEERMVEIPYVYYGYQTCNHIEDLLGASVEYKDRNGKVMVRIPAHSSYLLTIQE